jgi:hypothetical protein
VLFLTEHHAMKAYWGSGSITPCILDLGTRWRWMVSFTPRPLYLQGTHRKGGWVGPTAGLDAVKRTPRPCRDQSLPIIQPVRNPALYHWAIPAPILNAIFGEFNVFCICSTVCQSIITYKERSLSGHQKKFVTADQKEQGKCDVHKDDDCKF